jgi:hypothetical protein
MRYFFKLVLLQRRGEMIVLASFFKRLWQSAGALCLYGRVRPALDEVIASEWNGSG